MTPKQQWIRDQYEASSEKNVYVFTSILNTQSLVANPVPQGNVPKAINLTGIVNNIPDADVLLLNTTYAPLVDSIIKNIDKGSIPDLANLIRGLSASNLSQAAKDSINSSFQEIALSYQDPATYGDPDPNWQAQIWANPAELAGYDSVAPDEVVKALAEGSNDLIN